MDNQTNPKKGLPQELPEELLADIAGGGDMYFDKGYKVLRDRDIYGICEKYQCRRENPYTDDCVECRYFRAVGHNDYYYLFYCTYPDDYYTGS